MVEARTSGPGSSAWSATSSTTNAGMSAESSSTTPTANTVLPRPSSPSEPRGSVHGLEKALRATIARVAPTTAVGAHHDFRAHDRRRCPLAGPVVEHRARRLLTDGAAARPPSGSTASSPKASSSEPERSGIRLALGALPSRRDHPRHPPRPAVGGFRSHCRPARHPPRSSRLSRPSSSASNRRPRRLRPPAVLFLLGAALVACLFPATRAARGRSARSAARRVAPETPWGQRSNSAYFKRARKSRSLALKTSGCSQCSACEPKVTTRAAGTFCSIQVRGAFGPALPNHVEHRDFAIESSRLSGVVE